MVSSLARAKFPTASRGHCGLAANSANQSLPARLSMRVLGFCMRISPPGREPPVVSAGTGSHDEEALAWWGTPRGERADGVPRTMEGAYWPSSKQRPQPSLRAWPSRRRRRPERDPRARPPRLQRDHSCPSARRPIPQAAADELLPHMELATGTTRSSTSARRCAGRDRNAAAAQCFRSARRGAEPRPLDGLLRIRMDPRLDLGESESIVPTFRSDDRNVVALLRSSSLARMQGARFIATSNKRVSARGTESDLLALELRSNASNPGVDMIRLWEHENVVSAYRVAEDLVPAREARGLND